MLVPILATTPVKHNELRLVILYYNSNVLENFFISLLAMNVVSALVTSCGARFQSLAQSMLTLTLPALVLAVSFHLLFVISLTSPSMSGLFGLFSLIWKGYEGTWVDFHASISFISPASWFTDGKLYFLSNELEFTCSFSDIPSYILIILFWATCTDFMFRFSGSVLFALTWLHSCNPYLSLDIQKLWMTFTISFLGNWFLILLRLKVLLLSAPVRLARWSFQFCFSSIDLD